MTTLFVISGPSGAGKSSLIRRLLPDLPRLRFSVSTTTRAPRPDEFDGVNYHFVTREHFLEQVAAGLFLEHAEFSGQLYGTSSNELTLAEESGGDLVLDIEVQGARQLQEKQVEAVYIFVAPPSLAELERRLRFRKTETEQAIQRRLRQAIADMPHIHRYQYVVVNDILEEAYLTLRSIIVAERSRQRRMLPLLAPMLASFAAPE
jgi:guanylate kinase